MRESFRRAFEESPETVNRFIDSESLSSDQVDLTGPEKVAWQIEQLIEAATLAQNLLRCAADIKVQGESIDSAFLKIEEALEAAQGAIFSTPNPSIYRLQRILSGQPLKE